MYFLSLRVNLFFYNFFYIFSGCQAGLAAAKKNSLRGFVFSLLRGNMKIGKADVEIRRTNMGRLAADFYDAEKFLPLCRACPNFGKMYSCPPFESVPAVFSDAKAKCTLLLAEISTADFARRDGEGVAEFTKRISDCVRGDFDKYLLSEEATESARRLAFFAGSCANCPIVPCPRGAKKKCPRPDFLRPSLEAYGFDVAGIIREFFGRTLEWAAKEKPPQTFRLLAAIAELPRVS